MYIYGFDAPSHTKSKYHTLPHIPQDCSGTPPGPLGDPGVLKESSINAEN